MIVIDAKRVGTWVCERTGGSYESGTAIGLEKNGELVAGVLYDQYNGNSACMHVASSGDGRWMTREFLRLAFEYPFVQLKLKKLIGLVDSTNAAALRFDTHLGFVTEAIIKDAGKHGDLHILTMTPEQCRFIRKDHGR